jgi:acyl carrier protein phosphodiesterase
MNYLAHAYLSFNQPDILIGNMISDFVKGKTKFNYPAEVQKGIAIHRAIDDFTDQHAATRRAKEFFRPTYRLYSGAFIDIVYDHFLANDINEFPGDRLEGFSQEVYKTLEENIAILPQRFGQMFSYMKTQNWLLNYKQRWGIEKSFGGMVRRAKYLDESAIAFELFNQHYDELQRCYDVFFPDLKSYTHNLVSLTLL